MVMPQHGALDVHVGIPAATGQTCVSAIRSGPRTCLPRERNLLINKGLKVRSWLRNCRSQEQAANSKLSLSTSPDIVFRAMIEDRDSLNSWR